MGRKVDNALPGAFPSSASSTLVITRPLLPGGCTPGSHSTPLVRGRHQPARSCVAMHARAACYLGGFWSAGGDGGTEAPCNLGRALQGAECRSDAHGFRAIAISIRVKRDVEPSCEDHIGVKSVFPREHSCLVSTSLPSPASAGWPPGSTVRAQRLWVFPSKRATGIQTLDGSVDILSSTPG